MRKVICIIILSCLLIDMAGSWLMFGVFRQSAKNSMQSFIQSPASKKGRIDFFITPQNNVLFEFNEDEDEFTFQSLMYDIISKKQVGDTIHISCLMDDDETVLVNNYNTIRTTDCVQKNDHGPIKPFHFFFSVYEPSNMDFQSNYSSSAQIQPFTFLSASIYTAIFTIVKPPPKIF